MNNKKVRIYTDGGCRGNPGIGGWGAVIHYDGHTKELKGGAEVATNNQMELMAAISAFESLDDSSIVDITTDSQYVKNGITKWVKNWKAKGWVTSSKTPVKNKELWQRLEKAVEPHDVKWLWVKGHSGHPDNERADKLANEAMNELS